MRRSSLIPTVILIATITGGAGPVRGGGAEPAGGDGPQVESDFNGDGYSDLAIGVPGENLGSVEDAGVVQVLYGTATGLEATGKELWHQDTVDKTIEIQDDAEDEDAFGSAVAAGYLDGDGFADLVVGVSGEDFGAPTAGVVHVIYGSAEGLTAAGNDLIARNGELDGVPIKGVAGNEDGFGTRLATGNFGKSAADDLVIGIPSDDVAGEDDAGSINILYGSGPGVTAVGQQLWHQNSRVSGIRIKEAVGELDTFGSSLASGDFGKNGRDDLAVGVPGEDLPDAAFTGAVNVFYGSKTGLEANGNQIWHQDSARVRDAVETNDFFGDSVAAANFGRKPRDDLAIGVPREDVGTTIFAGAVNVLYGSPTGLTGRKSQFFHQNSSSGSASMEGVAEIGDRFGSSVLAANFGSGARADLAVGAPGEDISGVESGGLVHVLFGKVNGLSLNGNATASQAFGGTADSPEQEDFYGEELGAGDFDGDGRRDLTVGVPDEDIEAVADAGAVHVFDGTGFDGTNDQLWHQDVEDVEGVVEESDEFGAAVTNQS